MFDTCYLLLSFWLFVVGTAVGSFINVVASRHPKGQDIFRKPSHCDHCKKRLGVIDLIPIFSWLVLRGKCRYCGAAVSAIHPVVELISGLVAGVTAYVALTSGSGLVVVAICVLLSWVVLLLAVYDFRTGIVPNGILLPAIAVFFLLRLAEISYPTLLHSPLLSPLLGSLGLLNYILASLLTGLGFLAIIILTKYKGFGMGDAKFGLLMGIVLGWPRVGIALWISVILGAAIGLVVLAVKRKRGMTMPFVPFLGLGTWIAMLWGWQLWDFVVRMLGLDLILG